MLPLVIPWILTLLFVLALVLVLKKKWIYSLFVFLLMFILNNWSECLPLHLWNSKSTINGRCLRIISFNIDGSSGDLLEKGNEVLTIIRHHSPDIVFLAEFNEQYPHSLDSLLRCEFPYSTFQDRLLFQYFYGNIPFFNNRRLKSKEGEKVGVYACSVVLNCDTIDIYGCHWASNNYNAKHEREGIENFNLLNYISNIHSASAIRKKEAEAIVREMSKSSHSAIVMGDMNDVGGSPALKILASEGLKDAWWEGGVGYGATIFKPLPYRIDHILFSKGLSLGTISVLDSNGISDHNALFAEFYVE